MKLSEFDFDLPPERIALRPMQPRDAARMLRVCHDGTWVDALIRDLPGLLRPGDIVVFNDTKVIPARLWAQKAASTIELLLHQKLSDHCFRAFARPARKLSVGDRLNFADSEHWAQVLAKLPDGQIMIQFHLAGPDHTIEAFLETHGEIPLPPYITSKRIATEQDRSDYQTCYAQHPGSVAAPTAGLHFTESLLAALHECGIAQARVTLHVGAGTFQPVKAESIADHTMHAEWYRVDTATADAINQARSKGGRVIAVGTTSLRTLESVADHAGNIQAGRGETRIFITPGYRFRAVDLLLTNFHLPKSTLFMLVSAFCGLETMQRAYAHAIEHQYRFFSYGDACLLERLAPSM